jgi:hypothetical protein
MEGGDGTVSGGLLWRDSADLAGLVMPDAGARGRMHRGPLVMPRMRDRRPAAG